MNWKPVGGFLSGLVIGVVCALFFAYFMFDRHFDMFGYVQVTQPEQRDGRILLESLLFVGVGIGFAFMLRASDLRSVAGGFLFVVLFVLLVPLYVGPRYLVKSNYREPFNQKVWLAKHPLKMSREIEKTRMVNGKTREEVTQLLGAGDSVGWATDGIGFAYHDADWEDAFLYVQYKNNKAEVVEVGCYCD